mmetsp:Transcript_3740/g.6392  ORF Transcript_3740/g.6392 Transcript_3740/m.6392 type:complete len:293 (-) Transcript_3740:48-926(-)
MDWSDRSVAVFLGQGWTEHHGWVYCDSLQPSSLGRIPEDLLGYALGVAVRVSVLWCRVQVEVLLGEHVVRGFIHVQNCGYARYEHHSFHRLRLDSCADDVFRSLDCGLYDQVVVLSCQVHDRGRVNDDICPLARLVEGTQFQQVAPVKLDRSCVLLLLGEVFQEPDLVFVAWVSDAAADDVSFIEKVLHDVRTYEPRRTRHHSNLIPHLFLFPRHYLPDPLGQSILVAGVRWSVVSGQWAASTQARPFRFFRQVLLFSLFQCPSSASVERCCCCCCCCRELVLYLCLFHHFL